MRRVTQFVPLAALVSVFTLGVCLSVAHADRSAAQGPSGLWLQKKGRYAEAAVYYQRAVRGFREVWIAFWHHGDLAKAHPMTRKILVEYRDRLATCLAKARMSKARLNRMNRLNELWMSEYVDEELGGYKLAFARRAEEAEKHGDFLLAAELRSAAADYCRLVVTPYHERLARKLEKGNKRGEAALHRKLVSQCTEKARRHRTLAKGDHVLARIAGLQGPRSKPKLQGHYFNSYRLYHKRVLSPKRARWLSGRTPDQVAILLISKGLTHADENARIASVTILAGLDRKQAVARALDDRSARVRLAAAKALAAWRWAGGWAACYRHADKAVRDVVEPMLSPAGKQPLTRTYVITELLSGSASEDADTRNFCLAALTKIAGDDKKTAVAWREWWKGLGDAKPGLVRTSPGSAQVVDETVDVGAWWQTGDRSIHNRSNPLVGLPLPAVYTWRGRLVVDREGSYRFYVRSRGEKKAAFGKYKTLYFVSPCAKLKINDRAVLADESRGLDDAKMHMRIDWSEPILLKPGLHKIELVLDVRSSGAWAWEDPSVRLYWSSEHFLRELIPGRSLVVLTGDR